VTKRTLSPYEQNELHKWASKINPDTIGEKPVEYVTGHATFKGLDFLVTCDTLIPRIESEGIVDMSLKFIEDGDLAHPVIADIGTGSGILAAASVFLLHISSKNGKFPTLFFFRTSPQRLLKLPT